MFNVDFVLLDLTVKGYRGGFWSSTLYTYHECEKLNEFVKKKFRLFPQNAEARGPINSLTKLLYFNGPFYLFVFVE